MLSRWMRAVCALAMAPAAAFAFDTVDAIPWPSAGRFEAAWPPDPISPTTFFAYAGAMHDSNPLRRSSGEQADSVMRYGVGARSTARVFGRQSVLLEGVAEYFDYHRFDAIDHFAYRLRGEWLWELGNQLAGNAGYTRRRRHADLGEFQDETRVLVTEDHLFASGAYRFTPDWRLTGGADYARFDREGAVLAELERTTARGGIEHVSTLGNTIGVEARVTEGNAPIREAIPGLTATANNDFEERELAATLGYALGAQLRVGGRLGRTERTYRELTGRNFSGSTYRGRVDWVPESKLIFNFEVFREPTSIIEISASHVLRTGTAFAASWAATFKLVFTARFLNERRQHQGEPSVALLGTPARDETLRIWRFGAGWEPQRHWRLGAGLDIGERTSNQLGRDYDYTAVMLNLSFTY